MSAVCAGANHKLAKEIMAAAAVMQCIWVGRWNILHRIDGLEAFNAAMHKRQTRGKTFEEHTRLRVNINPGPCLPNLPIPSRPLEFAVNDYGQPSQHHSTRTNFSATPSVTLSFPSNCQPNDTQAAAALNSAPLPPSAQKRLPEAFLLLCITALRLR